MLLVLIVFGIGIEPVSYTLMAILLLLFLVLCVCLAHTISPPAALVGIETSEDVKGGEGGGSAVLGRGRNGRAAGQA